ncbi:MAG: PTS transporter subunit EIIC, partial [Succiniclasticum sp.]
MKFLQSLGKAIMLPVACLPLCGILMGIGYLLCPAAMQGGSITGTPAVVGMYLVKAGGALIDHIALLFAVGIGVGMADDGNGAAGIASLVSWLMLTTLLQPDTVKLALPSVAENASALLAFAKIENPFIGILAGLIGALSYNRFKKTVLPEWLAFFSGRRSAVIVAGLASILAAALLLFIWPVLFAILIQAGQKIAGAGAAGAGLYAFLNRLLIPLGLHHALNNVFWFDTIGLGDLTNFWAGKTSADVSWSLGMYMSGFFPCMMFGVPGAALAMVQCAKQNRKSYAMGIVASAALCSFVCGITEPF